MKAKRLWVVGFVHGDAANDVDPWSLIGVYDNLVKAESACLTPCHFVGTVMLNATLPDAPTEWPGAYYPHKTKGV